MKVLALALVLLAATGLLLAPRLVSPTGGSGGTLLPVHPPTATATPTPSPEVQPDAEGPREPQDLAHRQSVRDRFVCASCHGPEGGWPSPDDHESLSQDCTACHAPAPEPSSIAIHRTPGEAATEPLCSFCHGNMVRGIPRQVAEAEECSSCHQKPAEPVVPLDHEGRSVVSCMVCHQTKQLAVPQVQHRVQGWEECSFCHGKGRLTVPEGAHQERKDDECLRCHDSASAPPEVPRVMLRLSTQKEGCTSCHAPDRQAPLPTSHAERTEALCSVCHTDVHDRTPLTPHSPDRNATCVKCHTPERLAGLEVKHEGISEKACNTCHASQPGAVPSIPHEVDGRTACTNCHSPSAGPPTPAQPPP